MSADKEFDRWHKRFRYLDRNDARIAWEAGKEAQRRAPSTSTAPIAAGGGDLPPLPEPRAICAKQMFPKVYALGYTADQMREYGAACVAAAAGAAKGGDGAPETAAIALNRAQQGEPVACVICGSDEPRTGTCGSPDPRALCNRVTIKEAAPADAPIDLSKITSVVMRERAQHEVVVQFGRSKVAADKFLHQFGGVILAARWAPVEDAREQQHTIK